MLIIPVGTNRDQRDRIPLFTAGVVFVCLMVLVLTTSRMNRQAEAEMTELRGVLDAYRSVPYTVLPDDLVNTLPEASRRHYRWNQDAVAEFDLDPERARNEVRDENAAVSRVVVAAMQAASNPSSEPTQASTRIQIFTQLSNSPSYERKNAQYRVDVAVYQLQQTQRKSLVRRFGYVPAKRNTLGLLAHMFMHAGWLHLIFNMIFLWPSASSLEEYWGVSGTAAAFVFTGVAGALAHGLFAPGSAIPMIGASGAVAGMMGAFLVTLYHRQIKFFYLYFLGMPRTGTFWAPSTVMIPLWFGGELFYAIFFSGLGGVAYWAHVGGFVAGVVFAMGMKQFRVAELVTGESPDQERPEADDGPAFLPDFDGYNTEQLHGRGNLPVDYRSDLPASSQAAGAEPNLDLAPVDVPEPEVAIPAPQPAKGADVFHHYLKPEETGELTDDESEAETLGEAEDLLASPDQPPPEPEVVPQPLQTGPAEMDSVSWMNPGDPAPQVADPYELSEEPTEGTLPGYARRRRGFVDPDLDERDPVIGDLSGPADVPPRLSSEPTVKAKRTAEHAPEPRQPDPVAEADGASGPDDLADAVSAALPDLAPPIEPEPAELPDLYAELLSPRETPVGLPAAQVEPPPRVEAPAAPQAAPTVFAELAAPKRSSRKAKATLRTDAEPVTPLLADYPRLTAEPDAALSSSLYADDAASALVAYDDLKSLGVLPDLAPSYELCLGRALDAQGRHLDAALACLRAFEQEREGPHAPMALYLGGRLLAERLGRTQEGLRLLGQVVASFPSDPLARDARAHAARLTGTG